MYSSPENVHRAQFERADYYFDTVEYSELEHHAAKPKKSAQRLMVMGEHPTVRRLPPLEVPEGP